VGGPCRRILTLATLGMPQVACTFVRLGQQDHDAGSIYGFVEGTLGSRGAAGRPVGS